ncbi:MAG: TRAP transporter large permease subunit [Alphaproteobacteria bacterium]|nr:TRAP transporter large permease subunit [Alphaproteobacteria bacterium]
MAELPIAAWMFPALFLLVFLGIPVSFSLIVTALGFGFAFLGTKVTGQFHNGLIGVASNFVLAAIPLFVFMGSVLERSGIAKLLFDAIRLFLGRLPGGLALTTTVMCAIFAASAGVVGAVEILVGLMAIPAMTKANYKRDLAAGTICAGGSLGTMIPPSIVVVIYASLADISIGDMYAGMIIPAAVMVCLFLLYILIRCTIDPASGPGIPSTEVDMTFGQKVVLVIKAFIPAIALMMAVLGSIFAGVASPSEAAALGALGAVILSICYRQFSIRMIIDAMRQTILISSMVLMIVVGGVMFTGVFILTGGGQLVRELVTQNQLSPYMVIFLFLAVIFVLGFILDWISIVLITIPIFGPIVKTLGIDPVWFGVLVCITIQTSYLTPPMAPSIFYLRAIAPPSMTYMDMYKGVIPFILLQIATLAFVVLWPKSATYLPDILFGF